MKESRLKTLGGRVKTLDTRKAKPLPKETDSHYGTAEHKVWRKAVLDRAGWRCEEVVDGRRCENRHPTSVMYSDHIIEIKDRGAKLDPANGKCRCASHHVKKTLDERAKRMSASYKAE